MTHIPTLTIHFDLPKNNREIPVTLTCSEITDTEPLSYTLILPFELEQIPLILRALNLRQYPNYPTQERPLTDGEDLDTLISELRILGLWDDHLGKKGAVKVNAHELVGRKLGASFLSNPSAEHYFAQFYNTTVEPRMGEIILSFAPVAEKLVALPWEVMYDSTDPILLSRGIALNCTRIIEFEHHMPFYPPIDQPLRVLTVTPRSGMSPEYLRFTKSARDKMVEELRKKLWVEIEELATIQGLATMDALSERLHSEPTIHILDFIGHGTFTTEGGALILDSLRWQREEVPASRLAKLPNLPQLIVVNACQSALTDLYNPFSAIAIALSRAGVRAVLAMQLAIRIEAVADYIAPIFYREIANTKSVQQAITEVRRELHLREHDTMSWYVPALYLRQPQPFLLTEYLPRYPDNPFTNKRPINDYSHLVGRRDELAAIRTRMNRGMNSFSIIGQPGSGKTSILTLMYEEYKNQPAAETRVFWLMLDPEERLTKVKGKLAELLATQRGRLNARPEDCERMLRDGRHTIILIDDLSKLHPTKEKVREVRRWFKSLLDNPQMRVQIVASSVDALEVIFEGDSLARFEGSPLHSVLTDKVYLKSFNDMEAREFISKGLVGTPFQLEDFVSLLTQPMVPNELREACETHYNKLCKERNLRTGT